MSELKPFLHCGYQREQGELRSAPKLDCRMITFSTNTHKVIADDSVTMTFPHDWPVRDDHYRSAVWEGKISIRAPRLPRNWIAV